MEHWYEVSRRYRVEDVIVVKAKNAKEAKELVTRGEYEYVTDPEMLVNSRISLHPERLVGMPRWAWEEAGYPDDEKIAT